MSLPRDPDKLRDWQRRSAEKAQANAREKAMQEGRYSSMQASREQTFARRTKPLNRHAANTANRKRSELARQSAQRKRDNQKRRQIMREHFGETPACQRCDRAPADHVHELVMRSAGGSILDPTNCRAVCFDCHRWIHDNPAEAERTGWLIRSTHA